MIKCKHGVYDPHGDARYCTVCNPVALNADTEIETSRNVKLAAVQPLTTSEKKSQERYEKRLEKKGLGVFQPMTDNSDGEMAEVLTKIVHPRGKSEDHMRLRVGIDGSETFMDAYQIQKVRSLEREVPEWTLNKKEIQRVLLAAFPKLRTSEKHAKRAGRWARIIQLYFRMQKPRQLVAKELNMKDSTLKTTLRNIERVGRGLTVMGTPRRHPSHQPMRESERKDEDI